MNRPADTKISRVQVGCGPKNLLAGWWNVDIRGFPGIDEVMDVTRPWPWSQQLSYVYGEHFLEHLTVPQASSFLIAAGNALRVGGKMRLSTPSLEWVIKTHFSFEASPTERKLLQTWEINRAFRGWGHQFLYSKEMLIQLISSVGFGKLEFFDYGVSNDADLAGLERHGNASVREGYPSVWIVEATRTEQPIALSARFEAEARHHFLRHVESGH